MIGARQRDVPRAWNLGRQQATVLRRYCAVTVAVDDQRRRLHLRQEWPDVDVVVALHEPGGVFRRRGHALELVQPLLVLRGGLGDESTREHLAEGGIVEAPP